MKITLTGATGFIGGLLIKRLLQEGHQLTVLARKVRPGTNPRYLEWDSHREVPAAGLEDCDAVIHLAGEPVAQRWNAEVKEKIRTSRVEGTRRLVSAIAAQSKRPKVLISASAIGIYGSRGNEVLTERSIPASGFLEDVTVEWEREARNAEPLGVRVAMVRIGIVLGDGGALKQMVPPFRMGVGGRLGSGEQWMSWIHVDDLVEMILFALHNHSVSGPLNGTAPQPVTNRDFTRALAAALHRPAIFPVPEFALQLMFGEMARVMLSSQRVLPEAPQQAGFRFRYPEVTSALQQLFP